LEKKEEIKEEIKQFAEWFLRTFDSKDHFTNAKLSFFNFISAMTSLVF
jgi:hypothetical protein